MAYSSKDLFGDISDLGDGFSDDDNDVSTFKEKPSMGDAYRLKQDSKKGKFLRYLFVISSLSLSYLVLTLI